MKSEFNRSVTYEDISRAIQDLAEEGLIVDSGRKKWCERTRQYEILWTLSPGAKARATKSINSLSSSQMLANIKTNLSNSINQ
jgi:hypothetical protein